MLDTLVVRRGGEPCPVNHLQQRCSWLAHANSMMIRPCLLPDPPSTTPGKAVLHPARIGCGWFCAICAGRMLCRLRGEPHFSSGAHLSTDSPRYVRCCF